MFDALSRFTLRDYQQSAVDEAVAFARNPDESRRRLYSAPTGTGKSVIMLSVHAALEADSWVLTPSLEILRGFLRALGVDPSGMTGAKLAEAGVRFKVTTPLRYRNGMLKGDYPAPQVIIADEVHHWIDTNEVSGTLFALAPGAIFLGYTATPYRGSPQSTQQLKADWGPPREILSIPTAIDSGYMSLPKFEVVPLCDDDQIKVQNGEFVVAASSSYFGSRLSAIAELVHDRFCENPLPTAVTVPSSEAARLLCEQLSIPAFWIHQGTAARDRAKAYEACASGRGVLVSIRVLAEGVDLPWLRRLIDARPTMSPVAWVQQVGRIMRPGPIRPEYLCVCRNLERHAWALQGAVPREWIAQAQQAFEAPSKRALARAIGLEKLGRFKPITVPLKGGALGLMYSLRSTDENGRVSQYGILLDPCHDRPLIATRTYTRNPATGEYDDTPWRHCELNGGFSGWKSETDKRELSPPQARWWSRRAASLGLDPEAAGTLERRQFQALPILNSLARHDKAAYLDWRAK